MRLNLTYASLELIQDQSKLVEYTSDYGFHRNYKETVESSNMQQKKAAAREAAA